VPVCENKEGGLMVKGKFGNKEFKFVRKDRFMVFLNGKRIPCATAKVQMFTVFPKKLGGATKLTTVVRIWTK